MRIKVIFGRIDIGETKGPHVRLWVNILVLLALYRVSLPKATQVEVSVLLTVTNGHDPMYQPYSPSQITIAEDMLKLTRKRGITSSFQVYDPFNL